MSRILVIDDNQELCEMLRIIIMDAGHEVETARGGDEGIRMFKAKRADLVITDILMPQRSGLETIVELKKLQPNLKLIAISGGFLKENVKADDLAMVLGVDRILAKPIEPDDLVQVIGELVKQP